MLDGYGLHTMIWDSADERLGDFLVASPADAKSCKLDGPEFTIKTHAGVTLKEKQHGGWRVSVRTRSPLSAADICAAFGGGGHMLAAGCELEGTAEEAVAAIVAAVERELNRGL